MKRLFAAILILCMIPAVSFAAPVGRELFEYLFLQYWEAFGLPSTPDEFKRESETYYTTDEFVVNIIYDSNENPTTAISLYYKDFDFDFITYNLTMIRPLFDDEYEDAFLMSMATFKNGKGYWETSDGKGSVSITREKDYISVFVFKR